MTDLHKCPDVEVRTPRETFAKRLHAMGERLDKWSKRTLSYKEMLFGARKESEFQVRGLWVFGSFARGAATCGDLDLVMDVDGPTLVSSATLSRAFLGSPPNVRVFRGSPQSNDSGVTLPGAVQVWGAGMNWRAAIDAIAEDPAAGRFSRPADLLPLRAEQHRLCEEDVSQLLEAQAKNVVRFRFVPLSALTSVERSFSDDEREVLQAVERCQAGSKKSQLAPVALELIHQLRQESVVACKPQWQFDCRYIQAGGLRVYMDQFNEQDLLLMEATSHSVAFIPTPTTRGPNGAWVIERGDAHPHVQAVNGLSAWAYVNAQGQGVQVYCSARELRPVLATELFNHSESVQRLIEYSDESSQLPGSPEDPRFVRLLQGRALLEVAAGGELVQTDGVSELPWTSRGMGVVEAYDDRTSLATIEELAAFAQNTCTTPLPGVRLWGA